MMELSPVITLLQERFGCNIHTEYYAQIAKWREWWCGQVPSFHSYRELGVDGRTLSRKLYSMRMAKKICEDWAGILLNEKTTVSVSDPTTSLFLQGKDGKGGVLGENHFWQCGNALVEKAFALGTGAFLLRVRNLHLGKDSRVKPNPAAKIELDFVEAGAIIPLSVRQQCITEAAFVSEVLDKGKKYIYLETHALEKGRYVIQNEYFCVENGVLEQKKLPEGMAERVDTGSKLPWFSILRPNTVSHMRGGNGLGQSIYADAIDNLKGVDIAFHNFVKDFKLGGKKVFYNKSMLRTNEEGKAVTPDDVAQSLFMQIDGDMDFDAKSMVQEFNPSLRVDENKAGVQAQLSYLSFKCGLGTRRYRFAEDERKQMTATEYIGSQQELVQNAARHSILIEKAIRTLFHAILYVGKHICSAQVEENAEISIRFEDGYIVDTETLRERDQREVQAGLLQAFEYRMKWFGEDEPTAKKMCQKNAVAQETTVN